MPQFTLSDLSLAYLSAGAVIGLLLLLARQNQKQGWQKRRVSWFDARAEAAADAFRSEETPILSDNNLHHMGDLARLRQALTAHGESRRPEPQKAPAREAIQRTH